MEMPWQAVISKKHKMTQRINQTSASGKMATAGLGYKGRAGAKPKQIVYCFISEAKRRPDLFPRRRSIVSGSLERERESCELKFRGFKI